MKKAGVRRQESVAKIKREDKAGGEMPDSPSPNPQPRTLNPEPFAPGAHIHLIAVGGVAMATFAAMLKERGYQVSGSDQGVYPPMSDFLARAGITVLQG